jgi:predicted nucleic acid-binding protein
MPFVLDASVSLAWCFEDEVSAYADHVLERLDGDVALAPAVWPLEVANALCVGERRKRLQAADIARLTELMLALPVTVDGLPTERAMGPVLALARAHELSSYDACYLELAMREGLPLATEDTRLREAAPRAGVRLLAEG